ncbi:transesterase, partial [Colletotrichum musicola]
LFYYAKAFGEERNDTTYTNALHYLASATKIITTVAVIQCVERGQLRLDENFAKVLPEQHLTHSSGLAYVFLDPLLTRYAKLPIAEPRKPISIKAKFYPFLVSEPGERWIYSPGVDWAGRMAWERAGDRLHVAAHTPWADPVNEDFGGSGLYSTVSEVLKIYQGILDGRLLRQDTVKTMFQPQLKTTAGLDNQPDHSTSYRNAVYNSIPSDTPWIDLEKGVAGVYLSQLTPTGDEQAVKLLTEFEKFVYQSIEKLKDQ